jgi:tRNA 2-thiouridine synthesizing protein D
MAGIIKIAQPEKHSDTNLADDILHYTIILTHSPNQRESNISAQKLVVEIIDQGDNIDRIFFYQDACYIGLATQVPGQGQQASFQGWVDLHTKHSIPLQACIANSIRRGILDKDEAKRYSESALSKNQSLAQNLHKDFQLVGLGELAEACHSSDRIITL